MVSLTKVKLKIKKLSPEAVIPSYAKEYDAGLDLNALEDVLLPPGGRMAVATGLAIELPRNHAALVWDRSGLALKDGVVTLGGVIDEGYRGEVKVILQNLTADYYQVRKHDRIAQLLIQKVERPKIEVVGELGYSDRGEGGFGSTGS